MKWKIDKQSTAHHKEWWGEEDGIIYVIVLTLNALVVWSSPSPLSDTLNPSIPWKKLYMNYKLSDDPESEVRTIKKDFFVFLMSEVL
jgi:hypothetical protein